MDTDTEWLDRLLETVADCTVADSPMGPLAYRYGEDEGFWEINVYPTPVELVGGAVDGEVVAPGFTLDIEELRAAFDRIVELVWHSMGFPHDEGPRLVVEGVYQGRQVADPGRHDTSKPAAGPVPARAWVDRPSVH